jgi:hypothetical protein
LVRCTRCLPRTASDGARRRAVLWPRRPRRWALRARASHACA